MRKLLYVPILHTSSELGSIANRVDEQARAIVGDDNWQRHKEVVNLYWQAVASFWEKHTIPGLKIFQDAMPASGTVGEQIVKNLASNGSVNHKLIEQLLARGAMLIQTEKPELLKKEYTLTRGLIKKRSLPATLLALLLYKWRKGRLLKERDAYIISRINESLCEGETGVCFLGAYHQILSGLPGDIEVIPLKDPLRVGEYSRKATRKTQAEEVKRLGAYMIAPIDICLHSDERELQSGEKNGR